MSNYILTDAEKQLLRDYMAKMDALAQREPERLPDEIWDRVWQQIQATGEIPAEYADRIGVNDVTVHDEITNGEHVYIPEGKPAKAYFDIIWEAWNAEAVRLSKEYNDLIKKAIISAIDTKSDKVPASVTDLLQKLINDESITADEVREKLPQLISIIPQSHIMPNNKLANKLTSFTSDLLFEAEAIDLVVSGRNKSEVTTRCILSYEGDNLQLSSRQPFTEYDRSVADAVTSLYEYGDESHIITAATVYRAMVHDTSTETPSSQSLGAVTRSLDKMRFVRVQIDCTEELKRRNVSLDGSQITGGKIDTYLLALEKIEVMAGGKKVTAYRIMKAPILYDYARLTKQVLTVPAKLLDVPNVSNTEGRISVKNYLLRRISVMKGKTPQSNRILFTNVYDVAGKPDADKKEKERLRKYALTVLDYWKKESFIKGYELVKDGKTIAAVDITP